MVFRRALIVNPHVACVVTCRTFAVDSVSRRLEHGRMMTPHRKPRVHRGGGVGPRAKLEPEPARCTRLRASCNRTLTQPSKRPRKPFRSDLPLLSLFAVRQPRKLRLANFFDRLREHDLGPYAGVRSQILAISADGESARDIVTAGIIEPLVTRVLSRADPEEELAALQNLGATQDNDDSVKSHMATVGVIPAVLRHVQPRNCNSSRLAAAVVLNLAIESEERKTMLFENGACEAVSGVCWWGLLPTQCSRSRSAFAVGQVPVC